MKLVIVESPTKVKTISKYLGTNFIVLASIGHIMKLADVGAYKVGVDTKNNFDMSLEFDKSKKDILKKIKDTAEKADEIFICSDPDREGMLIR